MKPLTAQEIKGTWVTALLPITPDDRIDFGLLAEEVAALVSTGVDGIYTNGTAGEFYNQTEDEFDRVSTIAADACEKAGVSFQIGASQLSPIVSLERVKRAAALKPGAIQVILPDWTPPSTEEMVSFLSRAARAAEPIGLVLYMPPDAKVKPTPEVLGMLRREVPSLVGIKVGPFTEEWVAAVRSHAPELSIFVTGRSLATGLRCGAHGAYSIVATLNPAVAKAWYDQMAYDMEGALELERRIHRFWDQNITPLMQRGYVPHALDKLLVATGAWGPPIGTRLRWPYRSVPASEAERLRPIAREMLPEFFAGR